LTLVAAAGVADGIVQGAVFGDAATLPSQYTQAVVGGTAFSGVAVSLLRIITKAMFSSSSSARFGLRASAQLYFLLSAAVCAACYYVYNSLIPALPAVQYYRQSVDIQLAIDDDDGLDNNSEVVSYHHHHNNKMTTTNQSTTTTTMTTTNGGGEHSTATTSTRNLHNQSPQSTPPDFKAIYATITTLSISMIIIYIITLSIFPGVLAEDITSSSTNTWYPILLITVFNIADWLGKSVPYNFMIHSSRGLLYGSSSRILFIPLFYLCSSSSSSSSNLWGVGVLSVMLGASNGWMTGSAFVAAADKVDGGDVDKAGLMGNLMVLSLVVGLCVGAACGMLWLL
jgi:equilibrative nucleoside transporter 1/2/3